MQARRDKVAVAFRVIDMKRATAKTTGSGSSTIEITMLIVALAGLLVIVALAVTVAFSTPTDSVGEADGAPVPITPSAPVVTDAAAS
jgi:flagellar basal body-associated protein FliL